MILKNFKHHIENLKPLQGGITYEPLKWEKQFKKSKVLGCAINDIGKHISRKTVITKFKEYYAEKNGDYIIPFLYTMIWGYDSNYGPHRTHKIMLNAKNMNFIKSGIDLMNDNKFDEAYESLKLVKGLGISYISKILYFAGRAKKMKQYPLIFDIRVATAFMQLVDTDLSSILKIVPSDSLESYKKYNAMIHDWAKQLNVDAEQIEFFLFEQKF
jgi:hypothetical protein